MFVSPQSQGRDSTPFTYVQTPPFIHALPRKPNRFSGCRLCVAESASRRASGTSRALCATTRTRRGKKVKPGSAVPTPGRGPVYVSLSALALQTSGAWWRSSVTWPGWGLEIRSRVNPRTQRRSVVFMGTRRRVQGLTWIYFSLVELQEVFVQPLLFLNVFVLLRSLQGESTPGSKRSSRARPKPGRASRRHPGPFPAAHLRLHASRLQLNISLSVCLHRPKMRFAQVRTT